MVHAWSMKLVLPKVLYIFEFWMYCLLWVASIVGFNKALQPPSKTSLEGDVDSPFHQKELHMPSQNVSNVVAFLLMGPFQCPSQSPCYNALLKWPPTMPE